MKSKYQDALSSIMFTMHYRVKPKKLGRCEDENIDLLQELVDQATPKEYIVRHNKEVIHFDCPVCDDGYCTTWTGHSPQNYCSNCGQRLVWSKEHE